MSTKKKPNPAQSKAAPKEVDTDPFAKYSLNYQTPGQKILQWVCMLLIVFGLLAISWGLPFPYLKFLGSYNGFFNWSSFLIAAAVYYYYKQYPGLSYVVFLLFFLFAYAVMKLADLQKAGGLSLLIIGAITFITGAAIQFTLLKLKNKKPAFGDWLKFMLIAPVWVPHFLFKKKKVE